MKLRVKIVFSKSRSRLLSGLAKDTVNSTDLSLKLHRSWGLADGTIQSLAHLHIGHPELWFEKIPDGPCVVIHWKLSLEMDLREWRGWPEVLWDRTGMGTTEVSKIETRPPETGKESSSTQLSQQEKMRIWNIHKSEPSCEMWKGLILNRIDINCHLPHHHHHLPDIHITQRAISMQTHSTDCE